METIMLVKELIAQLKSMRQDARVLTTKNDGETLIEIVHVKRYGSYNATGVKAASFVVLELK
jgi:hypothetical protein